MEVKLDSLDPKLLVQTRSQTRELHAIISTITDPDNTQYHNKLLKLATFVLPTEKDKAYQQKINMTNYYGKDPTVYGLAFSVAHSVDGTEDYLGVQYVPELIVEGAWEAFQEEKMQKSMEAKARREAKELKEQIEAKVAGKVA
jgi:hypothetical protein